MDKDTVTKSDGDTRRLFEMEKNQTSVRVFDIVKRKLIELRAKELSQKKKSK